MWGTYLSFPYAGVSQTGSTGSSQPPYTQAAPRRFVLPHKDFILVIVKEKRREYGAGMNKQEIIKRLKRTAIFCVIAVFIGAGIGWVQVQSTDMPKSDPSSQKIAGASAIGGPFTLINQDGKTVTEKDFEGQYKLIYFGFTYCPAICPTELQKIAQLMDALPAEIVAKIQPMLISIDPERDTPAVLKDYVSLFHPSIIGLTGSQEQIDTATKNYKIFAKKVQDEDMSDYTMDHSTFTYLMSPDNELISIYRLKDSAEYIKEDVLKKIEN